MSFLLRLFRKAPAEEDYEQVLSSLANDIQKRQVALSEIRLRERRSTLLVTLYALSAYIAYVSMWYLRLVPNFNQRVQALSGPTAEKAVKALPVTFGPIAILFIRRIVQVWYKRKGDAEEKTLQGLLKTQRTKLEQIKKNTNYYSMRNLIERYDDPSPLGSPIRPNGAGRPTPQQIAQMQQQATPQRPVAQGPRTIPTPLQLQTPGMASPSHNPSGNNNNNNNNANSPLTATNQLHLHPQQPLPPPRKQWYDKLADALLGDDAPAAGSNKYALICERCFTHNGLVKEDSWEDAQYKCPSCGHFNASIRSKAKASKPKSKLQPQRASPTTPTSTTIPVVNGGVKPKIVVVQDDSDEMIVDRG